MTNSICKQCGHPYGNHRADGNRCPNVKDGNIIGFSITHFEPEISEIDQLRAELARLTTSNEYANNLLDEQGAHINNQSLKISALTAGSEAMQRDAVQNTITVKMLMEQLAEVNEENRDLRQMLHMEPK